MDIIYFILLTTMIQRLLNILRCECNSVSSISKPTEINTSSNFTKISSTNVVTPEHIATECITEPEIPITIFDTHSINDSLENLHKLNIKWEDTTPFIPPINSGLVIKVYDGDTITIASKLPYPNSLLYRFSVRLNGIDCPEIKGKTDNEKRCAQVAKKLMSDLVLEKVVILKNVQTEKYGRILADVYINDIHVNQYMLDKRVAVKYDGGTKIVPKDWMNYYLTGEL